MVTFSTNARSGYGRSPHAATGHRTGCISKLSDALDAASYRYSITFQNILSCVPVVHAF